MAPSGLYARLCHAFLVVHLFTIANGVVSVHKSDELEFALSGAIAPIGR